MILNIINLKQKRVIFSSFNCKIGDSIIVKSKVIKKEKSEEKYEDAISSGNAAIFVRCLPNDENKIIINMGNIPPNNEVIFTSEFIHPTEVSKKYEFEFFRNLPIFMGKNYDIFPNLELNGTINTKEGEINKLNENINELNEAINKKEEEINKLNENINELNETINKKEEEINKLINDQEESIQKKEKEINE